MVHTIKRKVSELQAQKWKISLSILKKTWVTGDYPINLWNLNDNNGLR